MIYAILEVLIIGGGVLAIGLWAASPRHTK